MTWRRIVYRWIFVGLMLVPAFLTAGEQSTQPVVGAPEHTRLVVYQQDLALVWQQFRATITRSQPEIQFAPVPQLILPQTVTLLSLTDPKHFTIQSLQYHYDPLSGMRLLDAYKNKSITVILPDGSLLSGTLIQSDGNSVILHTDSGVRVIGNLDKLQFQFPAIPSALFTRPTLVWKVDNLRKSTHQLELSYLTRGFFWEANYVAELDEARKELRLTSGVTIKNRTRVSFTNARLTLVAGQLHLLSNALPVQPRYETMAKTAAPAPAFRTQPTFEYHRYTLNRSVTIPKNDEIYIPFVAPATFPFTKKYIFDARQDARNALVEVHFTNQPRRGKAVPLPAGTVRVFVREDDTPMFVGEARIPHTPVKETMHLRVGKAFDVLGERKEVSRRQIAKNVVEREVEVELRNRKKDEAVTVEVREYASGEWKILHSNFPYRKENINTVIFTVPIEPGERETLKYRIQEAW